MSSFDQREQAQLGLQCIEGAVAALQGDAARGVLMKKAAMTRYHACVWIDHREAKVFGIGETGADQEVVLDTNSPAHIHRSRSCPPG
jgi:hypothetical protein